ncbi:MULTISPECIES: sulfurtransferase complex subunit TusC [Pasteurella]|uniref:sulfurtransferase complex subunit TusC n=1 Tax=Pasteurella TaxID=745 RepID=UPI000353B6DE|nr:MULTISPECIES: sulfurtransferase complex subunit TusC [Pasteurella]AHE65393.1 sulfur relay protein TusC [Pasteurella multocida subsp. multocida str. HB03]AIN47898.1 sulfur relay protein TusC/DsrF [Pasteurella multocida]AMM82740.1 tRNA 2-thiouridine(34) synthase TusC [Pasteurella multocida subsp. multocida PMTB2.1]APW57412.1 sulfurtransferase TusC [Pasteurella multocida]AUK48832.1 tRNA 2-thiouridine(34) synthase TusC [Pasteurella multocida]
MKLAFVFRSTPFGRASTREGLDALLAATAFCDEQDIAVFFLDDGVFSLLNHQDPAQILQKDVVNMFKLLDLYDIEQRYICLESLATAKMTASDCIITCEKMARGALLTLLGKAERVLTF